MMGAKLKRRLDGDEVIDPRFVRAISSPLRVEIMVECTLAPTSPTQAKARRPGDHPSLQAISHHFRVLVECEVIEEAFSRRGPRGPKETFYRATARALFSESLFKKLPEAVKGSLSATIIATFNERAEQSLLANTLDSHDARHLTWTPLVLDLSGFLELNAKLDEIFESLPVEQMAAAQRCKASGERPMQVTVGMFAFESPPLDQDQSR
jgi:hypothetical protein